MSVSSTTPFQPSPPKIDISLGSQPQKDRGIKGISPKALSFRQGGTITAKVENLTKEANKTVKELSSNKNPIDKFLDLPKVVQAVCVIILWLTVVGGFGFIYLLNKHEPKDKVIGQRTKDVQKKEGASLQESESEVKSQTEVKPLKKLHDELLKEIERRNLRGIERDMQTTSIRSGRTVVLPKFGESLNPVSKLGTSSFFSKTDLEKIKHSLQDPSKLKINTKIVVKTIYSIIESWKALAIKNGFDVSELTEKLNQFCQEKILANKSITFRDLAKIKNDIAKNVGKFNEDEEEVLNKILDEQFAKIEPPPIKINTKIVGTIITSMIESFGKIAKDHNFDVGPLAEELGRFHREEILAKEQITLVDIEAIKKDIIEFIGEHNEDQEEVLNKLMQEHFAKIDPANLIDEALTKSQKLYSKDDLINQLRIQLVMIDPEREAQILENINKINNSKFGITGSRLITANELGKILGLVEETTADKQFDEKFAKEFDDQLAKIGLKKLPQYFSTLELLEHTEQDSRSLLSQMLSTPSILPSGYYFVKSTIENENELKAARSAAILNLGEALVDKAEWDLPSGEIEGAATSRVLKSKMMEGSGIPMGLWVKYIEAKKKYAELLMLEKDTVKSKRELDELSRQIASIGSPESIQMQGLFDLLYASEDSHINQYIVGVNGDIRNIDFSRFLAPSPISFIIDPITGKKEYIVRLRSALIDHPSADQPLAPKIKNLIGSWDLEKIKQQHKGLVGSKEDFEKAEIEMKKIEASFAIFNADETDKEALRKLFGEYGLPWELASVAKCKAKLKAKEIELQKKYFKQIHPKAFESLCHRIALAKEYVSKEVNPTIKGLRDVLYPQLKTFYTVLERMKENPSQNFRMIFQKNDPPIITHSLSEIIEDASEKGLASDNEITEMQLAIQQIEKEGLAFDGDLEQLFGDNVER
jgi:hypothetical protein